MSFTLVGHIGAQAPSADADVTTGTLDTTVNGGADLIVIGAIWHSGIADPTVSDNQGNTYTALTKYQSTHGSVRLYYKKSPTTSATHTFALTGSFNLEYLTIVVLVVNGALTSSDPFNAESGNQSDSASSLVTNSVSPAATDLFVSATMTYTSSGAPTISSFSLSDAYAFSPALSGGMAYLLNSGSAQNETWSRTGSGEMAVTLASFKAAAAAAATVRTLAALGVG
jgi:hypothetical protein